MKKSLSFPVYNVFLLLLVLLHISCDKDKDGTPGYESGNMELSSVVPAEGGGGTMVVIKGNGLGDIRSISFDNGNVPAEFNSTLNAPGSIIFRVPTEVNGGPQNIVLTNGAGRQLAVPFNALAFPVVDLAFPTDFKEGSTVTLTGNNLEDVSKVVMEGSDDAATIISQTKKELKITMPSTAIGRGKLSVTNVTGELVTSQEFVNVNAATRVFDDNLVDPAQNWGWGGNYNPSTDFAITGTSSLKAEYDPNGEWGGLQIGMGSELSLPAGTRFISFWARGADEDKNVTFTLNGNGWSGAKSKVITVPANKWTYFREDLTAFYPGLNSVSVIVLQINGQGKTIYFDNIMLFK